MHHRCTSYRTPQSVVEDLCQPVEHQCDWMTDLDQETEDRGCVLQGRGWAQRTHPQDLRASHVPI
eukprot:COSAG01_NODE_175_length_22996_cov_18.857892_22_plen_65_part_00